MLGDFINRLLLMLIGYAYPAFECYKVVEKNKIEIELLRFWCQYWILVAIITVCERFTDVLISWLPMYGEMKLAFFIYLWHPKTKGSSYVYDTILKPYMSRHETEIDRKLQELQARGWDLFVFYWQNLTKYGQTSFYQFLHYLAAQSSRANNNTFQKVVNSQLPNGQSSPPTTTTATTSSSIHQSSKKQSPSISMVINKSVAEETKAETTQFQELKDHKKHSNSIVTEIKSDQQNNNDRKSDKEEEGKESVVGMDETLRSALTRLRRSNSRPQEQQQH